MKNLSFIGLSLLFVLPAFAQNQYSAAIGDTIIISWEQPTTRLNGSPLNPVTEISHYAIYFRNEKNTWAEVDTPLVVAQPSDSVRAFKTMPVTLEPGNYAIVVTAIDKHGLESPPSWAIWLRVEEQASKPARPMKVEIIIKRR